MKKRDIVEASAVILGIGAVFVALNYKVHRTPIPKREKVADCTSNNLAFKLTVLYYEPYAFIIGLDPTGDGSVLGQLVIRQGASTVLTIPLSQEDMTPCNWLPGLDGYVLTWGRTNLTDRLHDLLHRGETYDVEVTFSNAPPRGSSLWFSSMGTGTWR